MARKTRETVKNKNRLDPSSKARPGTYSRNKGHNYERKIAEEFRALGFTRCLTTRNASKLWDDCKLDLYGVPVNIQLKAVEGHVNYAVVLESMMNNVESRIPERVAFPFAVLHKKQRKELVIMSKEDFYRFLAAIYIQNQTKTDDLPN
jgi:hypothetical protein